MSSEGGRCRSQVYPLLWVAVVSDVGFSVTIVRELCVSSNRGGGRALWWRYTTAVFLNVVEII